MDIIKTYHSDAKDDAQLQQMIDQSQDSVKESCERIYNGNDASEQQTAAGILYGVLSNFNLTNKMTKAAKSDGMTKQAQSQQPQPGSRQRNGWVRGMRNKWNRTVDGFNEGTPWRVDRDKMYNYTHYYTDAVTFDEDPTHVYSGEAIWRNYIMDKFSQETQDKNGRWIGGYINNRYFVFPDAGTPANPGVDRMGGNQMELPAGERTRMPRPHQYSTERRLEEARGNKTYDIEVTASASSFVKTATIHTKTNKDIENDRLFNMFKDCLDMREAGISYSERLEKISEHYNATITGVAEIEKFASKMLEKHANVGYEIVRTAQVAPTTQKELQHPTPIHFDNGQSVTLPQRAMVNELGNGKIQYEGKEGALQDGMDVPEHEIQDVFAEVENETPKNATFETPKENTQGNAQGNTQGNTQGINK